MLRDNLYFNTYVVAPTKVRDLQLSKNRVQEGKRARWVYNASWNVSTGIRD